MGVSEAGNTVVPAVLCLEKLGFKIEVSHDASSNAWVAHRDGARFAAESPLGLLGLVTVVSMRGESWHAQDSEIDRVLGELGLD